MTSVTFEVSTIADAVRRAAKVAPGKSGIAFDKAAGILFEINPGGQVQCMMRATNLDAFHTEAVSVVEAEGDPVQWRLPSQLMSSVIGSLPPKSGAHITFTQEGSKVKFSHGRMRGSMNLIIDQFPDWEMQDTSNLSTVSSLGARIDLVEWAADSSAQPPLCGVYIDGEYLSATDKYKVARTPCKIEGLEKPVVIPAGILGNVLKALGDTQLGVMGTQLVLAPDDYTQVATVIYDVQYPPVGSIFAYEYESSVEVSKAELLEKLNRAGQYAGAERNPVLRTFWGKGGLSIMMENSEIGMIGDTIDCPGQLDHRRIEILFSPKILVDAVSHAPDAKIKLWYDSTITDPKISKHIKIEGGAGYECIIMKRQYVAPTV